MSRTFRSRHRTIPEYFGCIPYVESNTILGKHIAKYYTDNQTSLRCQCERCIAQRTDYKPQKRQLAADINYSQAELSDEQR